MTKLLLVARSLVAGNISVRLKGGQGVHADACIPKRTLRVLFYFRRIQSAETRAVRPRMFPPHNVWKRFREVGVGLGFLIEPGKNPVASESYPNVVMRVGVAFISSAELERILVLSDLARIRIEHSQR